MWAVKCVHVFGISRLAALKAVGAGPRGHTVRGVVVCATPPLLLARADSVQTQAGRCSPPQHRLRIGPWSPVRRGSKRRSRAAEGTPSGEWSFAPRHRYCLRAQTPFKLRQGGAVRRGTGFALGRGLRCVAGPTASGSAALLLARADSVQTQAGRCSPPRHRLRSGPWSPVRRRSRRLGFGRGGGAAGTHGDDRLGGVRIRTPMSRKLFPEVSPVGMVRLIWYSPAKVGAKPAKPTVAVVPLMSAEIVLVALLRVLDGPAEPSGIAGFTAPRPVRYTATVSPAWAGFCGRHQGVGRPRARSSHSPPRSGSG